jgi:mono/diheme cytochrome c family protein
VLRFLGGFVAAFVLLAVAVAVSVWFGLVPAGADVKASPLEQWMARRSLNATIQREMPQPPYPDDPASDVTLVAGAKLYLANCAMCHGSGAQNADIAKGMYIRAPQFAKHGVDDDPQGETYWKIEHGIRFSAMPSYSDLLTQQQIWQIAAFLKRPADQLPPAAKAIWNRPT